MNRKKGRPPGGITIGENGKRSKEYRAWSAMIQRCTNPKAHNWRYYGGMGIGVCDAWLHSFAAFLRDVGSAPEGCWLDRIDNSKGYEPGNVRWATTAQSARNRRPRPPVPGSLPQRAKSAGLDFHLVYNRIRIGWTEAQALATPKGQQPSE